MQLSQHFTLEEATQSAKALELGIDNQPDPAQLLNLSYTAKQMEHVRMILGGKPILVSSWFRSRVLNAAVGGVPTSAHAKGYAVDFTCPEFGDPLAVCFAIRATQLLFDQLIWEYGRWVHIAFCNCPNPRRQVLSKYSDRKNYTFGLPR